MFFNRLSKTPLEKAACLSQKNEAWEFSTCLARGWIAPRREAPYRPYLSLIVSSSEKILLSKLHEKNPDTDRNLELLLKAMTKPSFGAGGARRPQTVYLNNEDLVLAITSALANLDINCQYRVSLPIFNKFRKSLEVGLRRGREDPSGLLSIPGVTAPVVGHLYELAADYYHASPWLWLDDQDPLVISYPYQSKPRYGIVMGSARESFGLAVYDTIEDLRLIFRSNISNRQLVKQSSWLVLLFEAPTFMSFEDLDAISQYGWPIPNQDRYTFFGRAISPDGLNLPTKADLFWMEGAMSGIINFLHKYQENMPLEKLVDLEVPVTTINGPSHLRLQMPRLEDLLNS